MPSWNPQYKTLDHWRGVAALWVMIFHGFGTVYNKPLHPLVELVKSVAAPGWLGVHLDYLEKQGFWLCGFYDQFRWGDKKEYLGFANALYIQPDFVND